MGKTLDRTRPYGEAGRSGAATDTERAWVDEARRGNAVAFNRLVLRWETPIYNLALRMLHDPVDAEDTTQEAFLAAFRKIRRFRGDSGFSTWIYRIATNLCVSRLRVRPPGFQALNGANAPDRSVQRGSGEQEEAVLHAERRRSVHEALVRLHPDQKIVVELRFFQDRTFDEIAEILRVPTSTAKSRFYTALDLLKKKLGR